MYMSYIVVLNIKPSISWVDTWILSPRINGNPDELLGETPDNTI